MTNASKAITVGGWALLSCLVAGCSGGGEAAEAPEAQVVLNEVGYISVEESESDLGYCGYRNVGVSERGTTLVEQERYYYHVMNRLLDEDSALRDYTGLSRVTSCDEARQFTKLNNEYLDSRPAGEGAEDKAALLANFPIAEPETEPVEKILGGTPDARKEVLAFNWEKTNLATGKLESKYCSAVRLSGTMFLTAGHCLFLSERGAIPPDDVISFPAATLKRITGDNNPLGTVYATDPSRCTNLKPGVPCFILAMDGYLHPNFTGTDDFRNDLAVVHVRSDSQSGLRSVPEANADFGQFSARFSTNTPKLGDQVQTAGWGPNGVVDGSNVSNYLLRSAANVPVDVVFSTTEPKVNGVHRGMYFTTKSAPNAQICIGDSGGPTFNTRNQVMGVSSLIKPLSDPLNPNCGANHDTDNYFSRTDWQVYSFIPLAMQVLQRGDNTSKCQCIFIKAAAGETDPEAPGAAMRCNEGCTNPAEFTE